jgi:hypothetical protein
VYGLGLSLDDTGGESHKPRRSKAGCDCVLENRSTETLRIKRRKGSSLAKKPPEDNNAPNYLF